MISAILMLAQFTYQVYEDPFTDRQTYIASIEGGRGELLAAECGFLTDNIFRIRIKIGRPLYEGNAFFTPKREHPVRFDDFRPANLTFHYNGGSAYILGKDADHFAQAMAEADQVTVKVLDYAGEPHIAIFPLNGAREALLKVDAACPR